MSANQPKFFTIIPPNTTFDFVGNGPRFLKMSLVVLVASLVGLIYPGINWGVEFVGGTEIQVAFKEPVKVEDVRSTLANAGFENVSVQQFGPDANNEYLIRVERITVLTPDRMAKVQEALKAQLGDQLQQVAWNEREGDRVTVFLKGTPMENQPTPVEGQAAPQNAGPAYTDATLEPNGQKVEQIIAAAGLELRPTDTRRSVIGPQGEEHIIFVKGMSSRVMEALRGTFNDLPVERRTDYVDATVAEELRTDGILAMLYALGVMLIYIAIRFDFYFAPGAVVALFHDVLVAAGIVAWAQLDFDLTLVAALLTVVGYSINDTIVIYDRLREELSGKEKYDDVVKLVNRGINETLSRTVLTSTATLFVSLALLIFGGRALQGFALAIAVGILTGTYSSFAIATPFYLWLKRKFPEGILAPPKPANAKA